MKARAVLIKSSRALYALVLSFIMTFASFAQPVFAVDYNGSSSGPDPINGIIFYDGDSPACAAAPTSGIAQPTASLSSDATLEKKIAQTFIIGIDVTNTPKDVVEALFKDYGIGGTFLTQTKDAKSAGYDSSFYSKLSQDAGVPVLASSDEEGVFTRYNYTGSFPDAKTLGGMDDSKLENTVKSAAQQMKDNGLTVDLAPVLDLVGIGNANRNFSTDPNVIATKAAAYAKGLQDSGITPTFKHFPGFDTSTASANTDQVKVHLTTSKANLEAKNLVPYTKLLPQFPNASVMLSNLYVDAFDANKPASISAASVNYLRNTMKFSGMITTDDLAALTQYTGDDLPTIVAKSLQAGVTMPLFQAQNTGTVASAKASMDAIIAKVKKLVKADAIDKADAAVMQFKNGGSATTTSPTSTSSSSTCCGAAGIPLAGNDNMTKIYNYLISGNSNPLTPEQASGMLGNIQTESGFEPQRAQGIFDHLTPPDHWSDAIGGGYGIVQWTPGSKMVDPVTKAGLNAGDLGAQLKFLWGQLYGKSGDLGQTSPENGAGDSLRHQNTPEAAANSFGAKYERFAGSAGYGDGFSSPNYGDSNFQKRASQARAIYVTVTKGTPLPVNATDAAPTSGCGSSSGSGGSTIPEYKNPYRDVKNLKAMRMDEGVDYGGSGPIYAIGNGKVVVADSVDRGDPKPGGWPGGNYVSYTLSDGPAKGKTVYMSENCPLQVKVGDTVTPDTVLCTLKDAYPYSETGWSRPTQSAHDHTPMCYDQFYSNGGNSYATNCAQDFSKFLQKLGMPAGVVAGPTNNDPMPAGWPTW